ncbi:hypothetical protein ACIQRE_01475 [Streptomyces griseoluteus]
MHEITNPETVTIELPVLASADADEVTLGRQTFNDSDKSGYFEA